MILRTVHKCPGWFILEKFSKDGAILARNKKSYFSMHFSWENIRVFRGEPLSGQTETGVFFSGLEKMRECRKNTGWKGKPSCFCPCVCRFRWDCFPFFHEIWVLLILMRWLYASVSASSIYLEWVLSRDKVFKVRLDWCVYCQYAGEIVCDQSRQFVYGCVLRVHIPTIRSDLSYASFQQYCDVLCIVF